MKHVLALLSLLVFVTVEAGYGQTEPAAKPGGKSVTIGTFRQDVRTAYGKDDGLPSRDVRRILASPIGVYAATADGLAVFRDGAWSVLADVKGDVSGLAWDGKAVWAAAGGRLLRITVSGVEDMALLPSAKVNRMAAADGVVFIGADEGVYSYRDGVVSLDEGLKSILKNRSWVRQIALGPEGRVAVAAYEGLFEKAGDGEWAALTPSDSSHRWALEDVRGVVYDSMGRLWSASPQGAACREGEAWKLYTGEDGLPYDDFTGMAAGPGGVVWFGTRIGAVRFDGVDWAYRQGKRWLPEDEVHDLSVVESTGDAWFATPNGVSVIERKPMTLAEKAAFFEDEIDLRHRRTPYGFVDTVRLVRPGDKGEWVQSDSDNDGLWTSMYGTGECFAYAATKSPDAKRRAQAAFNALLFLGEVTQSGEHPAPRGFVARTILPTSGPNPNDGRLEEDMETREKRDSMWKIINPRWPRSEDGQWFWKSDTSSDELDGHYFFYAAYYDLVAETEDEKARVRERVCALTDHMIENDFTLIDWDGKPTRWARYSPKEMNHDPRWWEERGLNSLSMLSYLKVAEHVSGNPKYKETAKMLIEEHGYAMNTLRPKIHMGMGTGNQSDDEMAFMGYYNLLKYEDDPKLREIYSLSLHNYWKLEEPELNPLFNFIAVASITGGLFTDAYGVQDLTPEGTWLEDSAATLKAFPLDRIDWGYKNSHRKDIVFLSKHVLSDGVGRKGYRQNGKTIPVDERFYEHHNHDAWELDSGGNGTTLADGAAFLLPYYMGLYHGYIIEEAPAAQ